MKRVLWLTSVVLLAACEQPLEMPPAVVADDESTRLNAWFDEKFEERLRMNPMWMTRLGRRDRYGEIDDQTEAYADRQLAWAKATVDELKSSFDYELLDLETKTSYDLWVYLYEREAEIQRHRGNNYVFTQMQGPQSGLPQFMTLLHKVESEADMVAYVERIGGVGTAIRQLLEIAIERAASGVRPPRFAYEEVANQVQKLTRGAPFTEDGGDAPLWRDANDKIQSLVDKDLITPERADALRGAADKALTEEFLPAYEALGAWIAADVEVADPEPRGAGVLPNGEDYYNHRLATMTTTSLSAEEVHDIGLAEVVRIQDEMREIMLAVEFEGTLQEFFSFVRTDPQFFYPDSDEGRQGYIDDSDRYLSFINERLADYFGVLPKAGLVVRRVEAFREQDGAPQHYSPGTPDGSRPGTYYAHLSDMSSMPKSTMEAIAYHEGNPGHHMQISIAQESDSVPLFRRQTFYTAYVEGWGLYAEFLAKEMGAYENPYSDFGRLATEIWRAVRLVVDTGIHAKGWSEEQAVSYFRDNSPIAEGAIRAEVQRYFVWPGQATAYKIGMLKIQELRAYAEDALGDSFDIRAFHDTVLTGGALPLTILEGRIKHWVDEVKTAAKS